MTVLVVLLGLVISHYLIGLKRFRDYRWLPALMHRASKRWAGHDWLPCALILLIALVAGFGLNALIVLWLGWPGWFVFNLLVFVYCLGPRDLDRDVHALRSAGQADHDPELAARAARALQLGPLPDGREAGAAVVHAAFSRWFGILFWFVILGPAGALTYRLTRVALRDPDLDQGQLAWLAHLRLVIDWPVLVLSVISAGLCGDLDRVNQARRAYATDRPGFWLWPSLLDRVAEAIVDPQADMSCGLLQAHQMVWRMLVLWLVFMSLMLLAGWLS